MISLISFLRMTIRGLLFTVSLSNRRCAHQLGVIRIFNKRSRGPAFLLLLLLLIVCWTFFRFGSYLRCTGRIIARISRINWYFFSLTALINRYDGAWLRARGRDDWEFWALVYGQGGGGGGDTYQQSDDDFLDIDTLNLQSYGRSYWQHLICYARERLLWLIDRTWFTRR